MFGRRSFLKKAGLTSMAFPFLYNCFSKISFAANKSVPTILSSSNPKITFVLFNGMTALDLIGPACVLAKDGFDVAYAAENLEPITTESSAQAKLKILPTSTFSEIKDTEVLFVPGTSNPFPSMENAALQEFLSRVGQKAKWITSVCTGSMILGASGLLKGYKATTHWSLLNTLENFGAIPVEERVVIDRNRVTGAGVTSGIDFGLTLLSMLKNETAAQISQLMMEYDPAPPFNAGSPRDAPKELVEKVRENYLTHLQRTAPESERILKACRQKYAS